MYGYSNSDPYLLRIHLGISASRDPTSCLLSVQHCKGYCRRASNFPIGNRTIPLRTFVALFIGFKGPEMLVAMLLAKIHTVWTIVPEENADAAAAPRPISMFLSRHDSYWWFHNCG